MSTQGQWKRIEDRRVALDFWRNASQALFTASDAVCPICDFAPMRYYAHHFEAERSALWVWCVRCHNWTVASNMSLDAIFHDPYASLTPSELERLERQDWIERLEQLWVNGDLPQIADEKQPGKPRPCE